MRIVHVVRQFSPGIGGVENFVSLLAQGQAQRGHDVRVVTLDRIFDSDGDRLPHIELRQGVLVRRVGFFGPKKYPVALSALAHLRSYDLLHVHGIDFFADYLALTKWFHRRPMVISTHGGFFHTSFAAAIKKAWFQVLTRLSMQAYHKIIASSVQDAAAFERIAPGKVVTVENAVDTQKFAGLAHPARKHMIYFGRLAPNKGLPQLIQWFRRLVEQDPEWSLTIAGKEMGVRISDLRRDARAARLDAQMEFYSQPTDAELAQLIARSGVYVGASTFEGFGLAAVEAISAGLYPLLNDIVPFRRTLERVGFGTLLDFERDDVATFISEWRAYTAAPLAPATLIATLSEFAWPKLLDRIDCIYNAAAECVSTRDFRVD